MASCVVGRPRVDPELVADGCPSQQHAETHLVAIGEGELDGPVMSEQEDLGFDDRSQIEMPVRTADVSVLNERGFAATDSRRVALKGVDLEPDPVLPALAKLLDIDCVERRGPGAGVDLRLHGRNPDPGKADPFPPTNDLKRCPSFHLGLGLARG